jgi:membrane associated rhomboid family serine protease
MGCTNVVTGLLNLRGIKRMEDRGLDMAVHGTGVKYSGHVGGIVVSWCTGPHVGGDAQHPVKLCSV